MEQPGYATGAFRCNQQVGQGIDVGGPTSSGRRHGCWGLPPTTVPTTLTETVS